MQIASSILHLEMADLKSDRSSDGCALYSYPPLRASHPLAPNGTSGVLVLGPAGGLVGAVMAGSPRWQGDHIEVDCA